LGGIVGGEKENRGRGNPNVKGATSEWYLVQTQRSQNSKNKKKVIATVTFFLLIHYRGQLKKGNGHVTRRHKGSLGSSKSR